MMEENRMRLPGVRSPKENHIGFFNLLIGVGAATRTENHRQTGDARGVSGTVAAIDVVAAQHDSGEFLRDEIHFVRGLRTTKEPERLPSALFHNGFQPSRRPVQSLVPR